MFNDTELYQGGDNNRSNLWGCQRLNPADCTGPKAVVYRLRTWRNYNLPHPRETGQASRRLFFDMLAGIDPALSDELHEARKMKPYNCSFFEPTEEKGLYLWRVVDLIGGLQPILHCAAFRPTGPATVDLCSIPAKFEGVAVSPSHHPRAASVTWADLLENGPIFRRASICFLSPTMFKTGGRTPNMLMSPLSVMNGAAARMAFAGEDHFPQDLVRRVAQNVSTRYVNLRTESVRGQGDRRNYGVTGKVEFSCDSAEEEMVQAFSRIMSFLPWCGVGWATTAGMGQVSVEVKE